MRRERSFRVLLIAGALYAVTAGANPALSQATAVITGKVTAEGGRPVGGAQVFFPDFHVGANTAPDGSYTIRLDADRVFTRPTRGNAIGGHAGAELFAHA
jgi:hypothetical protein